MPLHKSRSSPFTRNKEDLDGGGSYDEREGLGMTLKIEQQDAKEKVAMI